MRFTVPGEPQGKGRPRVVRNGAFTRTYTPEKTATYENLVKLEFQRQCSGQYIGDGPVSMKVVCFYGLASSDSKRKRQAKLDGAIRPTKKPDCDNVGKVVADSLNGIAYKDDAQIVSMTIDKYFAEIPRVEVTIEEARPQAFTACGSAQKGPTASTQIKDLGGGTAAHENHQTVIPGL